MQTYPHGTVVIVLDCADLDRAATFWQTVLGCTHPYPISGPYLQLRPADGVGVELLLQAVPETKADKNRLHLDLRTRDLDAEVARVTAAGATLVTETPLVEHDWQWHVLADPDGNEFCILQPPDDFPWPEPTGVEADR